MVVGWFGTVISESQQGIYNDQVDSVVPLGHDLVHLLRSHVFRRVFRRAVLCARSWYVPWLPARATISSQICCYGRDSKTAGRRPAGGRYRSSEFAAWGIPALNTALLLTSGVTITIAHHMLIAESAQPADFLARR